MKGRVAKSRCGDDIVDEQGNELDKFDEEVGDLRSELCLGVSALQSMMKSLFRCEPVYNTSKYK